jgi:hypothetical protein
MKSVCWRGHIERSRVSTFPAILFGIGVFALTVTRGQAFSPGNLAILRAGDGTETLTNSGNSVFVDQFSTNGELLSSVPLPNSGPNAFLLSGVASSEGGLNRSADRTVLAIAGYNTNRASLTNSLSAQSAAAVPRAIATVNALGAYTLLEASTSLYSSNNLRCAVTDGTNHFWTAGGNSGTYYLSPPGAPTIVQSGIVNSRYVRILGGSLYFSTQAGAGGIYSFQGGGLPQSPGTTNLLFSTGSGSQPAGFDISPSFTVAYVADQRPSAGGIEKWTFNGTTWSLAYNFATGAGAFAIAVDFSNSAPVIYAITGEASSNRLVYVVDTNALASVNLLATAGSNRVFRGIDFTPEASRTIVPVSITIERNASNVILSWPVAASGYSLQSNPHIDQSSGWVTSSESVVTNGGFNTITIPATNPAEYYRLKR